jgi:peptidylprolyl isomerase
MTIVNPRVFLDIAVGDRLAGRMTIHLFHDALPITCENFRSLCTGETGLGYWMRPRWYKNSPIHRIVPGFMCQGGDFNFQTGGMGESIYGHYFRDERFLFSHSHRGVLSMASARTANTCNSQFFFTFGPAKHLDRKHVVFGQIEDGIEVLKSIEKVGSLGGKPRRQVRIVNCGELSPSQLKEYMSKRTDAPLPDALESVDNYDPVPDEIYKRARPYWDNTL